MNLSDIEEVLYRHPEEVMRVYHKYNIIAPVSLQTTLDMYAVYGEPFLMDLYHIHWNYESFLGGLFKRNKKSNPLEEEALAALRDDDDGSGGKTQSNVNQAAKKKGEGWDKFKGVFNDALGMFASAKKEVSGTKLPGKGNAGRGTGSGSGSGDSEEDDGTTMGIPTWLFWSLVGVLVILVVWTVYDEKRGK